MTTERTPETDKELWRSLAPDRDVVPAAVCDLDFAAWLDGRLSEKPRRPGSRPPSRPIPSCAAPRSIWRISWVSPCRLRRSGWPFGPGAGRLRGRARRARRRPVRTLAVLFAGHAYALQRAAMAAVAIVIAGAGFIVGGGLGESFAQQREGYSRTETASTTSSETSNEFTEFFGRDLTCRRA